MSLLEVFTAAGSLGHKSGSVISGGVFSIASQPSTKCKAGGQGIYRGNLIFTFSGGNGPAPIISGSVVGGGTISPTAVKVKADGQLVLREGDFVLMAATGNIPSPPGTTAVSGNVEIADAGQSKVKAE